MNKSTYVQYGCGWHAPENWKNYDASLILRFEKLPLLGKLYTKNQNRFPINVEYGDIVKGLPVPNSSCKAVYCSHVLEHLSLKDLRIALINTYKILKHGGIFRFVLPDLEFAIKVYNEDTSHEAAYNFMRMTSLGKERREKRLKGIIYEWLGNSQHLWMWDFKSIEQELYETGFYEVRRSYYGDSKEIIFSEVEVEERWKNCLCVECYKT